MPETSKEKMALEDLIMSQSYALQAIINLLDQKGMITREEIVQELKAMQATIFDQKLTPNSQEQ